jgi:hypothetical protein
VPVAACYVALLLLGALLGIWGAFLVPLRLFGRIEGLAVVVAVVGNLGAGLLGGIGTGTRLGAALPGAAWLIVAVLSGITRSEGDLVVPGGIPSDPGVGTVGMAFLLLGAVAAAIAVGIGPVGPRRRGPAE